SLAPKADYCNCRAVSPRRIDVRGAVSCKVKAVCPVQFMLPEIPAGLQVRQQEMVCCGKTLSAEKIFTVREEIETGASGIACIIHSEALPKITDLRVIADKAVVKGMVEINALYGIADGESAGCTTAEHMNAEIPISSILDAAGLTDRHITYPELTVMNCELSTAADSGIISCELLVKCAVRARIEESVVVPTDAYSTEYETEVSTSPIRFCTAPRSAAKQISMKTSMKPDGAEIRSVWDCTSELSALSCRPKNDSELELTGQLLCTAVGLNTEGVPFFIEKQEAVEQTIPAINVSKDTISEFCCTVTDTSYSIRSDGTIDVNVQADFSAMLRNLSTVSAISGVTVYEDKPKAKDGDFALRICFSGEDEDCWSIAKRYNTTVEAVMQENGLENESCSVSGMILIPTI
ncbi:MAG: SPOCS domain-containing protein, partial [Oscillospiraceae bacterium]